MAGFAPKIYQQQVLESIEAYFKACHELPSPSIAFTATTERLWGRGNSYNPLQVFQQICLISVYAYPQVEVRPGWPQKVSSLLTHIFCEVNTV